MLGVGGFVVRCRANMAELRQSMTYSGLWLRTWGRTADSPASAGAGAVAAVAADAAGCGTTTEPPLAKVTAHLSSSLSTDKSIYHQVHLRRKDWSRTWGRIAASTGAGAVAVVAADAGCGTTTEPPLAKVTAVFASAHPCSSEPVPKVMADPVFRLWD